MNDSISTEIQEMLIDLSEHGITSFKFMPGSPLAVFASGRVHTVGEKWSPGEMDTLAAALFGDAAIQEVYGPTGLVDKHWIVEKDGQSFPFIACAVKGLIRGIPSMDLTVFAKAHPSFDRHLSHMTDTSASTVTLH